MPVAEMTEAQREGYRHLVDGPRGRLPGPYKVWVHNPKLLQRPLPRATLHARSVVIDRAGTGDRGLVITSMWNSDYPNASHEKRGKEVGLPAAAVEAIIAGLAGFVLRSEGTGWCMRWRCRSRITDRFART